MLESVFLYAAIGGGVVLLTQLAMMLLGMDDGFGDGADAGAIDLGGDNAIGDDPGVDGATTDSAGFWFLEMISLRTLAAAATFFGLVGGAINSTGQPPGVSIALGAIAGYAAMYAVYAAFRAIFRLETSGNVDIRGAVGLPADVYVPIGAAESAPGKVHVALQGRTVEYQAVTAHDEKLPTGARVMVTDVVGADTVRVEPAA